MEFLRVASGDAAESLAVLKNADDTLPPRARALAALAVELTSQPWTTGPHSVTGLAAQGFDRAGIEAAVGVIAMFNYFTRMADASGIEFDYPSPLPTFEPQNDQTCAVRPRRPATRPETPQRPEHGHPPYRDAWRRWRGYQLESTAPIGPAERRQIASVAAEESTDWAMADALGGGQGPLEAGGPVLTFVRKLSREPWTMRPSDLDSLRAAGYPELAVLHVASLTAHQNADSRLAFGLTAAAAI